MTRGPEWRLNRSDPTIISGDTVGILNPDAVYMTLFDLPMTSQVIIIIIIIIIIRLH